MEETEIIKILKNIKNVKQKQNDEIGNHIFVIETNQSNKYKKYKIILEDDSINIIDNECLSKEPYDSNLCISVINFFNKYALTIKNNLEIKTLLLDILSHKTNGVTLWDNYINDFINYSNKTNIKDIGTYFNFLKLACESDSKNIFKYLVTKEEYKDLFNEIKKNKKLQQELSAYACYGGDYEIIHLIEENNFEFDSTALISAINGGNFEIFEYFIDKGVNPGNTLAAIIENGKNFSLEEYYNKGIFDTTINNLEIKLDVAKTENNKEEIKRLENEIEKVKINKEKVEKLMKIREESYENFCKAKEESKIDNAAILYDYLISFQELDINKPLEDGRTPLFLAVQYSNIELAKLLLEQPSIKESLNKTENKYNYTPLLLAVQNNDLGMVELLLKQPGIEESFTIQENVYERVPIFFANNIQIIDLLLKQPGIEESFNKKNCYDDTFLHNFIENYGLIEDSNLIEYIFQLFNLIFQHPEIKKIINEPGRLGCTPLSLAIIQERFYKITKLLLSNPETDINKPDNSGRTPLFIASELGKYKTAKLLLGKPGIEESLNKEDNLGKTPLFIAAEKGNYKIVELLLKQPGIGGSLNKEDDYGDTPLSVAVRNNNLEIVELLLKQPGIKESLNKEDIHKNTPLSIAVQNNNSKTVELLLKQPGIGKSLNKEDNLGKTPLFIASEKGKYKIVELLLKQPGIEKSLNKEDIRKNTPLSVAVQNNNSETVELLLKQPGIEKSLNEKNFNKLIEITKNKFEQSRIKKSLSVENFDKPTEVVEQSKIKKTLSTENFNKLIEIAKRNEKIFNLLNEKKEEIEKKHTMQTIPNPYVFISATANMEHITETKNSNILASCKEEIDFSFNKEEENNKSKDDL